MFMMIFNFFNFGQSMPNRQLSHGQCDIDPEGIYLTNNHVVQDAIISQ